MPRADLLGRAVYGLAEWHADAIRKADIIANPGCYPTATLLPLLPLAREGLLKGTVIVNAISGISGAGRKERIDLLYCERSENANAYYAGTSHRHAPEIAQELTAARRVAVAPLHAAHGAAAQGHGGHHGRRARTGAGRPGPEEHRGHLRAVLRRLAVHRAHRGAASRRPASCGAPTGATSAGRWKAGT